MKGSIRSISLVLVLVGVLAACQQQIAPTPLPLRDTRTTLALTPTVTPTPEPTIPPTSTPIPPTLEPTTTPRPTVGPSPTPPPATPEASLGTFSYCASTFGPNTAERFSASLDRISVERTSGAEQITLEFTPQRGQIQGQALCVAPFAANALLNTDVLSSVLRVELPLWSHDAAFATSVTTLTAPLRLDALHHVQAIAVQTLPNQTAGAVIEIGLDAPLPYTVKVEGNRLVISIAELPLPPLGDDPLGTQDGRPRAPVQPLIFTRGADLWKLENGNIDPISSTLALETAFAISPDNSRIAFCRAAPDAPAEFGALWVSDLDGSNEQLIADVGGCADPAWSFDGAAVWFVAPWSATPPLSYRLWTVAAAGGEAQPLSPLDEWSRRNPQPLPSGDVLTEASAEGNRSTLLLTAKDTGISTNIAQGLIDTYAGVGHALLSPDGKTVAVEALRADGGADLAILDTQGKLLNVVDDAGWWRRPLAWNPDGTLYYLLATCRSGQVLQYELHSLKGKTDKQLIDGATLDAIGAAIWTDEGLVYVRTSATGTTERGPQPLVVGPSELWLYEAQANGRLRLVAVPDAITDLQ